MSYTGQLGVGTTIGFSAVPPTTYTLLGDGTHNARIIGFTPPKTAISKIDTTCFDASLNPGGAIIEDNMPNAETPGEWGLKLEYDKLGSVADAIYLLRGVQKTWQVTYSNGKLRTFTGWISEHGEEVPLKDRMTIEIKIVINGGANQAHG